MDSINKNQPENNHENLSGQDAINKIITLVGKASACFFSTNAPNDHSNGIRPMSVQKIEEDGTMWFLSAIDSHKNKEIEANPLVKLYFQGSSHTDFLYLHGRATVLKDKAKIKELWEPLLKTWFTEGEKDPRISAIKIVPTGGYYWSTKHSSMVAGIKMIIGAAIGKTMDDSVEGELKTKSLGSLRKPMTTKKKIAKAKK